jgi:hypothetical protein
MNDSDDKNRDRDDDTPSAAKWHPTFEFPWRPVNRGEITHLFDYGQPWCNDRLWHPQRQPNNYPSREHHPTECRSYGGFFEGWFEDARSGLYGPPGFLSMYLARPFRFGEARWRTDDEDRLAIEFVPQEQGHGEPFRCSVPAGTIRNLAAHLTHTATVGDGWRPPRRVRRRLTD